MVFCDVFLLLCCIVVFCCTFVCFTETTAKAAGIARPPGIAARKVENTVLKEAKETQEVGRSGGVTARVAFLLVSVLVLVFAVFCLAFLLYFVFLVVSFFQENQQV